MLRQLLIVCLLLSFVLVTSGCVQQQSTDQSATIGAAEDRATGVIEQELDSAVENISLDDIENSLLQ